MPQQINSVTDLWVTVEADVTGANADKTAANSGAASTQPSLMVGTYNASLPTIADGTAGALQLDSSGRLLVGGIVAISASALPLPTGAATQATLAALLTELQAKADLAETQPVSLTSALPTGANTIGAISNTGFVANAGTNLNTSSLALETGGNLASINTKVPSGLTVTSTRLLTDGSGVTQPVSASALPLPAGAATVAAQSTGNGHLSTLAGAVAGAEVQVDIISAPTLAVSGPLTDTQIRATPLPISGTVSTGLSQGLTDAQLRATAVPVSLGALPAKRVFAADLVLDTAAYAAGDTLGDILEITNAVLSAAGTGILQSITVIDDDDQGQPFDLVFFNQTTAVGTKNAAWAVSDAAMANCLGIVRVESADFVDLGINRVATITPPPIGLQPVSGTSIFVGTISRGTGTYTAAGLRLVITIERD